LVEGGVGDTEFKVYWSPDYDADVEEDEGAEGIETYQGEVEGFAGGGPVLRGDG
jgi:hypothetical protein